IQALDLQVSGNTVGGTTSNGTDMVLSNSGTISGSSIIISSAPGQDLRLIGDGNGSFVGTLSSSSPLLITAPVDPLGRQPTITLGPGNQSFLLTKDGAPGGQLN
ncbi:hypothetical protein, partial [Sphingobium sp. 22B]|uniref:hypothetical protein n=1 Tax=Sphingobium sp. 22B TaxID=936474 RepID=UPI001F217DBD